MNALITPDQEPVDNIIPFKPLGNGKDENWLAGLQPGTCFACRGKNDNKVVDLMTYHVIHHSSVTTLLYMELPTGQNARPRVDTLKFSRAMELVEVLGVQDLTQTSETTDGTGD